MDNLLPATGDEALSEALIALPEKLTLWNVLYLAVLLLVCLLVSKIVLALLDRVLARSTRLDVSLRNVVRSAAKFILGFIIVLIVADALGIPITSLVALFSVIGLAVSLAVQGVLSNLAGGMVLLWAKPFQVGDFVEIDGVMGTVKESTLMYTKLNTPDNKLVYLTNKTVSETRILNFSGEDTRRIDLVISASYDSPIDDVKAAILEAIGTHPKTLTVPAPVVGVVKYGTSAIDYNVWFWCARSDYWDAYYGVNEAIKRAFDAHGLQMTYDHLNVHMVEK